MSQPGHKREEREPGVLPGATSEAVQIRLHGPSSATPLIYLPGLHGNWTLIGNFRKAIAGKVHFIETTYPPTLSWSLEDYATAVEDILASNGITGGWLLAESFSSQVAWPMITRGRFKVEGLVLAGGFVRHPFTWAVRLAERICGDISFALLTRILFGYATVTRWRFRNSPETAEAVHEFIARLTESERQAAKHRLHLVALNDPCEIARATRIPVYALTGLFDPVVPWYWVRRWLRTNCPALQQFKIVWSADHNVLGTGAATAANQIVAWMKGPQTA